MRHFLLNQGAKKSRPTAIPYLFQDRVMHPIYNVWTSRLICKWYEELTSVTPAGGAPWKAPSGAEPGMPLGELCQLAAPTRGESRPV